MQEQFNQARDEYIKLRARFVAGYLTEDQFDAALQELIVVDEQGRSWMIGANSGHWYYSSGGTWIQGEPAGAAPVQNPTVTATKSSRTWLLGAVPLGLITLFGLVIILVIASQQRNLFGNNGLANQTSSALLTPGALSSPVPSATALPMVAFVTPASSVTPTPFVMIPVTLTPTPINPLEVIPTITSSIGADSAPVEPVVLVTPHAPSPSLASNVYVTELQLSPNPAHRQEPTTYTATFLNTTGATQSFDWRIVLFNPNKNGHNKDWGQSNVTSISIPPGQHQFSISYVTATNTGSCIPLQAVASWRREDSARMFFPNTDGNPLVVTFQIC